MYHRDARLSRCPLSPVRDFNYASSQSMCALYQDATMKGFLIALLTKCHPDDRSKKVEVGRERDTYRNSRGAQRILLGNPEGKT